MISEEIRKFILNDVRERFLRYVQVYTASDETNETTPSTACQWDLLNMLKDELVDLGLADVEISEHGYVYATLPSMDGSKAAAFALLAHVDTSPDQLGENVKPQRHEKWNGKPITFPDSPDMKLTVEDSPELEFFKGDTIITASGKTLLGADDKAGVAEIMAAMAAFQKFPELPHGEIRVCFTPDEEIGRGTIKIDTKKLPKFCYTLDGGFPGELEDENFDAWRVDLKFKGVGVHPGYAKDKMINAAVAASRYVAHLPEWKTPEHTEKREGFIHVVSVKGDFENASVSTIVRDFEEANNKATIEYMETLAKTCEKRCPGLVIETKVTHQYENMQEIVRQSPEIVELADKAMRDAGVEPIRKSIRGGTDGARLTKLGHPTPNIFAGGLMFHSRREWIAESALVKAVETVLHLAKHWEENGAV
ncbi:MAG: peptidase T [bacterium]